MEGEIAFENGRISNFEGSWPWPWPWIGSYCIHSCIKHWLLPTRQISLNSKKLFVDVISTDGHLRLTLLRRLRRVDLKGIAMKSIKQRKQCSLRLWPWQIQVVADEVVRTYQSETSWTQQEICTCHRDKTHTHHGRNDFWHISKIIPRWVTSLCYFSRTPSRTIPRTVSSELLGFCV